MVDSRIMMTSHSSTMASSLERSLEMGAIHSDGLSDQERAIRQVKHSIKGHRRTHSVRATAIIQLIVVTSESERNVVHRRRIDFR